MAKTISISDAESVVMEVLWRTSPATSEAVIAALSRDQDWQEATIKTLLGRLLAKGAVRAAKDGRRYLYSPVLTREQWLSTESRKLIDRLFGGRVAPLVAHFSRRDELTKDDVAKLKQILSELERDA